MINKIPFLDLVTQHVELEDELVSVFRTSLRKASFVGGEFVERFESDFAQFSRTRYCVAVNSGTDALRFALIGAGVRRGDVVITVPNTFIATTEAISQAGAIPEFVDIDERTYNMDPGELEKFIETMCEFDRTAGKLLSRRLHRPVTGIIPVHLYGQMVDLDPILELAQYYNLCVIEDACQAHGAEYFSNKTQSWQKAGAVGRAAAFSFYPGKNLGACGEGGAVTTDDEQIASAVRMLRDHGQSKKYYHDMEGYNGRLDSIQTGLLSVKLAHLQEWNRQRCECAARYKEILTPLRDDLTLPSEPSWSRAVYHLYVVRSNERDALRDHLAVEGVGTAIHYPIPLHLQKAYHHLRYKEGDFPVSERVAGEILSLPMYPQLKPEQQQKVGEAIAKFRDTKLRVVHGS